MRSLFARSFAWMLAALSATTLWARTDPQWLRRWEAAQRDRPSELGWRGRIAGLDEPGTPLVLHGRVLGPDGLTPAAGVVVFAYQTDASGRYDLPGGTAAGWRLKGWARTGADGRFELRTIRPGPYPGRAVPAHVHLTLESAELGCRWTDSLRFADDPLVTGALRERSSAAGRFAFVRPVRMVDGVGHVELEVRLQRTPGF